LSLGRPDWRVEGRDWPHRQYSRFIQHRGIHWHVQVMGSGPPALLLHGTGASGHSFRDLMPLLASRFTLIVPDLPGHAFSAAPPPFQPSLPGTARAIADLLTKLELAPVVAIGHSAGAAVLAQMALDRTLGAQLLIGLGAALVPFRGASSLFAPAAARALSGSALAAQLIALKARDRDSVDRLVRSTGSVLSAVGGELYQRLVRCPGHVAAVLAMLSRWDLDTLFAALPALDVPLLLLAGEVDRAIPLDQQRELAAQVRGARLVVVPRTGHLLHEEQPAAVARLILDEADRVFGSPLAGARR
jgi:magnesium chelatase accessory protein